LKDKLQQQTMENISLHINLDTLGNAGEKIPNTRQQVSSLWGNLFMHKPYQKLLQSMEAYNSKYFLIASM